MWSWCLKLKSAVRTATLLLKCDKLRKPYDFNNHHIFMSSQQTPSDWGLQSIWHIVMAACAPRRVETSFLFIHKDFQLAKLPVRNVIFQTSPIWDPLSAGDKLESCFLGSPFRNRHSGSRLITFCSLRWPLIKKQPTNSNFSLSLPWKKPGVCEFEYEGKAAHKDRWVGWRVVDRQAAAETGRH